MALWHFHFGRSEYMSIEADTAVDAKRALMPYWRKANRARTKTRTTLIPLPTVEAFHTDRPGFLAPRHRAA